MYVCGYSVNTIFPSPPIRRRAAGVVRRCTNVHNITHIPQVFHLTLNHIQLQGDIIADPICCRFFLNCMKGCILLTFATDVKLW